MKFAYLLTVITVVFVGITHATSLNTILRNRTNTNRNFLQFGWLINGHAGNPLGYNGYGCWCGSGNRGSLVVDETDRCCQVHDLCWSLAEEYNAGCKPFWRWYDYEHQLNEIQCTDPVTSCDRDTCLCDKAAVECFASHRSTTYDSNIDNWEGICEPSEVPPENDLEWCPPVWRQDTSYPSGSFVNVNGIAYRAFYWVDPGKNPKTHSSTWQGSGSYWQKLGPCRQTYVDGDIDSAWEEAKMILNEDNRRKKRMSKE